MVSKSCFKIQFANSNIIYIYIYFFLGFRPLAAYTILEARHLSSNEHVFATAVVSWVLAFFLIEIYI